ncbi:hypothetical protein IQ266_04500 [filamentous cyanobacterium LEGE 11480]|uniref:Uncharacterized protein n=1 Tax=Romeriopsis navalis LEGE 11480 TaxID=2777977 RepID=A0A928VLV5_9CYAN|nr:hypothetical protein [Romeriopsis navalis]MBE9029021.1 hypothetical protein [Romeriopsis navalis LEGE 11480]
MSRKIIPTQANPHGHGLKSGALVIGAGLIGTMAMLGSAPQAAMAQRSLNGKLPVSTNDPVCVMRERQIKAGKWRTLEKFWNSKGTAYFRSPSRAKIRVRYGKGWLSKNRQKKTLNGGSYQKLSVGKWSLSYARMQMKVPRTTNVTYMVCSRGLAQNSPRLRF